MKNLPLFTTFSVFVLGANICALAKPAGPATFVSKPDLAIKIPNVTWSNARFSVRINRQFLTARQEQLLRKAEAVYPPKAKVIVASQSSLTRLDSASLNSNALWWWAKFDGVRIPYAVTASAASYYSNLIQQFRRGNFSGANGIRMQRAQLTYTASIRHQDAFVLDNRPYSNVDVATLRLTWTQHCGSLCGMTFDRTRTVVLQSNGAIAVSGDGAKSIKPV